MGGGTSQVIAIMHLLIDCLILLVCVNKVFIKSITVKTYTQPVISPQTLNSI